MTELNCAGAVFFVRRISYKDVRRATDGFRRIIYSNAEVSAYSARFEDGVCLVREVKGFDEGNDKFCRHVQFLGRLRHRHLLSLRGFSVGRNHKRFVRRACSVKHFPCEVVIYKKKMSRF